MWLDIESTGIDPESDELLELGAAITDDSASRGRIYGGASLVEYSEAQIESLRRKTSRKVDMMHQRSGLWRELTEADDDDCASVAALDMMLVDFITETQHNTDIMDAGDLLYLGGTSTLLDRMILNRDLPMTASMIHYHSIDTSTMQSMAAVNPNIPQFKREHRFNKRHRALEDALESVDAYRYYMAQFGISEPVSENVEWVEL